jgi:hypothetical protein
MECYIVCEDRANHSRIHVKICQQRCENARTCGAFQDYVTTHSAGGTVKDSEAVALPQASGVAATPA